MAEDPKSIQFQTPSKAGLGHRYVCVTAGGSTIELPALHVRRGSF